MKNKTRRLAAFLLSAAVVITAVPGMQERVYAQKTGGYTESPKSENVPVVKETKSRLKKAEAVPSAYMNKLSELTIRYPGVRDQGKYDTCWAFSAIGLAEFDLIADNQTADKSIDLSELQLAYFTYNNVEDPLGGTFGDSLNIMNHKNYLTMGGNLDFASRTLLQWEGVTDENRVPYALAPTTTTLAKSYAFDQDVAHLQNVYIINIHKNVTQVKREIMQHGSAGLGLYMDGTANYVGSAVYAETGENVATYYCPTSSVTSNHAVNIVGWDDNFPASSFKINRQETEHGFAETAGRTRRRTVSTVISGFPITIRQLRMLHGSLILSPRIIMIIIISMTAERMWENCLEFRLLRIFSRQKRQIMNW